MYASVPSCAPRVSQSAVQAMRVVARMCLSKNCYWGKIDSLDGDDPPNGRNCWSFVPFDVFPVSLSSMFGNVSPLCARILFACVTHNETSPSHIYVFRDKSCSWMD